MELFGCTFPPTSSMSNLKYFLADAVKHRLIVHQLYFIGSFLQAKSKNWIFLKLDSRYADYFPSYSSYFGRALISLKYVYGITNYGKLFLMSRHNGCLKQASLNLNFRCLYIISMHKMEQKMLFYIMLMIVSIGIYLKLLENGLWTL